MAIEHKFNLSTTEPFNNVGVIKVRQSDDQTQLFQPTILKNNMTLDLTGYKAFFMLRTETTTGIIEQEAKIIDAKNGRVDYTLNKYDWQMGGKNTAYFSFRKLNADNSWKEQFTTRDFLYTVTDSAYSNGITDSNYIWSFEDLLRLLGAYLESGMTDFDSWFETIKDTLGEDAAGALAMAIDLNRVSSLLSSVVYKKMNTNPASNLGNTLKICAYGNSLTAGNGASVNGDWLTRLKNHLIGFSRAGQTIDIINRGVGGDTTKMCEERWPTASGADLAIIFLGTNDYDHVKTMSEFSTHYEKIIKRELDNNAAVLLINIPQWGSKDYMIKGSNGSIQDYNSIISGFGIKYNLPVLDLFNETRNLDAKGFKVGEAKPHIHLSDIGYQMIAQKVSSLIGFQPADQFRKLRNGDYLGVRSAVDGIKFKQEDMYYYYLAEDEKFPTPSETTVGKGSAISTQDDEVTFSYAVDIDEDNLLMFPNFKFRKNDGSEYLNIVINGNNNPFCFSNPFMFYPTFNRNVANASLRLTSASFSKLEANEYCTQNIYVSQASVKSLPFAVKGHYTITITMKNCDFFGFDCVAGNVMKLITSKKDSGWLPMALTTGNTNVNDVLPSAYRKISDKDETRIALRMNLKGDTGKTVATLPPGHYKTSQVIRLIGWDNTLPVNVVIGTTGNIVTSPAVVNSLLVDVVYTL